jgi:hypothetical protein
MSEEPEVGRATRRRFPFRQFAPRLRRRSASFPLVALALLCGCLIAATGVLGQPTAKRSLSPFNTALTPGIYLTIKCQNGTVTFNGTPVCTNTTVNNYLFGQATGGVISATMNSTPLKGYGLKPYATSTLCLGTYPTCATSSSSNPVGIWDSCGLGQRCTGVLTATMVPGERVQFAVFENWSTGWTAGEVEACLGTTCATYANDQVTVLQARTTYTLYGVDLPPNSLVSQWNSSAGPLSNNASNPTNLSVVWTLAGAVSMVVLNNTSSTLALAGYLYSPVSNETVQSVSGAFRMLGNFTGGLIGLVAAVALGGLPGTALLEVGVEYGDIMMNGTYYPQTTAFWKQCTAGGTCTTTIWTASVSTKWWTNLFEIAISTSGKTTSFSVKVVGSGKEFSHSITFVPGAADAGWFIPLAGWDSAIYLPVFSLLAVGGTAVPLTSSLLAVECDFPSSVGGHRADRTYYPSQLSVTAGYPGFSYS